MRNKAELNALKKDLMLEAAEQWQRDKLAGAEEGLKAVIKNDLQKSREENFEIREAKRASLGITTPSDFGFEERLIGLTNDLKKVAPNETAKKAGRPVARIHEYIPNRIPEGFGTGFMVSSRLMLTNHHVFTIAGEAEGCAANFFYEYDENGLNPGSTYLLRPDRFFFNDKALDFALVAVEPEPVAKDARLGDIGFIPLIETPGKIKIGAAINIIQHPMGGPKQYAYTENTVSSINEERGLVRYSTDTLGASSGSPAFNQFYEVAALHHMGIPIVVNGKIMTKKNEVWDGEDEDDVGWLANEGISISRIVAFLKGQAIQDPEKARFLNELLGTVTDPLVLETKPQSPISIIDREVKPMNNDGRFIFNFYGNTTVNIHTSPVEAVNETIKIGPGEDAVGSVFEKKIRFDEDYPGRDNKGYDRNFLAGFTIELPTVANSRSAEMLKKNGADLILKYYHYSLAMNSKRRMAMWTAVNVDYSLKINKTRKELGEDTWRSDPRISGLEQITRKEVYDPARNFDLGHIVRRNDSAWGATDEEGEFSNSDTFHYTNCTPQHEAFNRTNPPKDEGYEGIHGIWGKLEDQIQKQLNLTESKGTVLAGPVLANDTDPTENFGLGDIQYPMKFWKIICVNDQDDGPISYGFLLDQTDVVTQFGTGFVERLNFNSFDKQQIEIKKITELTGVIFDQSVYDTDVLRNNFDEGLETEIPYENVENIQIRPRAIS